MTQRKNRPLSFLQINVESRGWGGEKTLSMWLLQQVREMLELNVLSVTLAGGMKLEGSQRSCGEDETVETF